MLGFSLSKLILLALVVGAVWYGYKLLTRLEHRRRELSRRDSAARTPRQRGTAAQTLTACPSCGAYYDASTGPVCADCRRR